MSFKYTGILWMAVIKQLKVIMSTMGVGGAGKGNRDLWKASYKILRNSEVIE